MGRLSGDTRARLMGMHGVTSDDSSCARTPLDVGARVQVSFKWWAQQFGVVGRYEAVGQLGPPQERGLRVRSSIERAPWLL